jgi:DNA helicase II / ATP-dependent DNA helicase PcrA
VPSSSRLVDSIDDCDIDWVAALMGLDRLDAPRREFLKSVETLDVSACPGSGKTTLVVAKLAILARKWPSSTQGICVLSHTNVAREEIERKLACTDIGHRLLGYPHYIDTIHGFVNRFLAIPWLLSNGHAVTAVDNDITTSVRRGRLGQNVRSVESYLARFQRYKNGLADIRLSSTNLESPLEGSGFPAGPQAATHMNLARALKETAERGYFCHDEMFLFAEALLAEASEVAAVLVRRFPFVLIDEMQDTSARQSHFLGAIFDQSLAQVCVQRVGDANQAIFDDGEPDEKDVFPDPARQRIAIPNSLRFDRSIASLAAGLALTPVEPNGLEGVRVPDAGERAACHTIFVFPDGDVAGVLPAYARHVLDAFDDSTLAKELAVTAVGEVHQAKPDVHPLDRKYPGTVSHYWDGYAATMARKASPPAALIDRIRVARSKVVDGGPVSEAIDIVAAGLVLAVNRTADAPTRGGARPHRTLERLLADHPDEKAVYRQVLTRFVLDGQHLDKAVWRTLMSGLAAVVVTLAGRAMTSDTNELLAWKEAGRYDVCSTKSAAAMNTFRVHHQGRKVDIRLGSIHGVKGQTHLATLVLETFYHTHALKWLMPWLIGERAGGGTDAGELHRKRLRMAYVALTRPSRLVCLALPQSSLGCVDERAAVMSKLAERGWHIVELY